MDEETLSIKVEIREGDAGASLTLQVPESTLRALGGPDAIRFYRDSFGRLRIVATDIDTPGAIPVRPMSFPVARLPQSIVPPPLPPGRYDLERHDDASLVVLGA